MKLIYQYENELIEIEYTNDLEDIIDNYSYLLSPEIIKIIEEIIPNEFIELSKKQGNAILSKNIASQFNIDFDYIEDGFEFTYTEHADNDFFFSIQYLEEVGIKNPTYKDIVCTGLTIMIFLYDKLKQEFSEQKFTILGIPEEEWNSFTIKFFKVRLENPKEIIYQEDIQAAYENFLEKFGEKNSLIRIFLNTNSEEIEKAIKN